MEAAMPKLKRYEDADNRAATDFIESLDRGLRVLELLGGGQQPMTLSDLAKAADLPRATARRSSSPSSAPALSKATASCFG